jgi:hypothetical protein
LTRAAVDLLCVWESDKLIELQLPAWTEGADTQRLAVLRHSAPDADVMRRIIHEARRQHIGYVYVTDGTMPNPWNRLPRWWEDELAAVAEANRPGGR